MVVLLQVLMIVGDRLFLPVLVGRGLKLVTRVLLHMQLQLLVLVDGRSLVLLVLLRRALLVVVVLLVVVLLRLLVLVGGHMLLPVAKGLQLLNRGARASVGVRHDVVTK
jgi:hypothetical protein